MATIELNHKVSDTANATVATTVANNSTVYLEVQCFLEGVQVPHSTVSVSYGIDSPPTCTIQIPASKLIRDLPETTKVHIFFKDFLPTSAGVYEWRLLFDGELSSFSYSVDASDAYIQLNAIHAASYMYLMQLMSLDISQFMNNPKLYLIGEATMSILLSQCEANTSVIKNIMDGGKYKSMADIVYSLMRAVLKGIDKSATGKYYNSKLGNVDGGWKILDRIYGVSKVAADAPVATYTPNSSNASSSGTGSGGTTYVTTLTYNDYLDTGAMRAATDYGRYTNTPTESDFLVSDGDAYASEYQGMNAEFMKKLNAVTDTFVSSLSGTSLGIRKFTFSSGFRSATHNAEIKQPDGTPGAANSRHTLGMAVDVCTAGWSNYQKEHLFTYAKSDPDLYVYRNDDGDYIHIGLGG